MKKKEILIIFILAVLVTGWDWFCEERTRNYGGFPMEFYRRISAGGGAGPFGFHYGSQIFQINGWGFLFNFLFWFLILATGWWVAGKLRKTV